MSHRIIPMDVRRNALYPLMYQETLEETIRDYGGAISVVMSHPQFEIQSAFQLACKYGQLELAIYLVNRGVDPTNPEALRQAIHGNHIDVVEFLVDSGADLNYHPIAWWANTTPIVEAIYRKRYEMLDYLLERGAFVNEYALHEAISTGDVKTLEILLDYDESILDKIQEISIVNAFQRNHPEMTYFLVEQGVDLIGKTPHHNLRDIAGDDMHDFLRWYEVVLRKTKLY